MSERVAEDVAAVFHAAALSADGNRGARRAATRVGDGLTVMSRSLGRVSSQPTPAPQPPPAAPALRRQSSLSHVLLGIPAFRAVARPLATESLLGPTPPPGSLFAQTDDGAELASDLEETGDNLRRLLRERVLLRSNLEAQSDGEALYRLRAEPTCRHLDAAELDEDCVELLTKVEVRVRLTREGSGARLELLIGAARDRAAALSADPAQLALNLFLDGIKRAAASVSAALGEEDETPAVLRGALRLLLKKEAERKVTFAVAVTQAIEVEERGAAPADTVRVKVAPADRAFALTVDGALGTVTGALGAKTIEVFTPWQPDDAKPSTAQMHLLLGGLSGQTTFTQATDEVKLTNLGLGTGSTYLEVRGQRIFQVDLNERDGRVFAATITFSGDGLPRLAINPRFDLALAFKLAAVASDFASPPASHLLDESYRFTLDPAAGQAPVVTPFDSPLVDGDGLRLVSGRLTLSSSKVSAPVTVSAGQCLTSTRPQSGQHPVLGSFAVGNCP